MPAIISSFSDSILIPPRIKLDLIVESIKQYGHEVKYIPRTLVEEDHIFGEDTLSKFQSAIPVEVYIQNVEGFEDVGEFVSRFGMEVHHQITFLIAKIR